MSNQTRFLVTIFLSTLASLGLGYFFDVKEWILYVFIFLVGAIAIHFVNKNLSSYTIENYIVISLFSIFLLVSTKGEQLLLQDNHFILYLLVFLFGFIYVNFILLAFLTIVLRYKVESKELAISRSRILIYGLPTILFAPLYLIAFFPGVLTPDSFAQWGQAHGAPYNNWHPLMYTLFIETLIQIIDSPAIVAGFQILLMGMVFGYCLYRFELRGVPWKILYIVAIVLALLPMNGIYSVTVWKDILYNLFLLLFTMNIIEMVISKGKWFSKSGNISVFIFSSLGLIFFRHNGFPVFLVFSMFLFLAYWRQWKQLLPITLSIIIVHTIYTGPIFEALKVRDSDPNELLSIPSQQLANVIVHDGKMTEGQKNYLNEIFPLAMWKEYYHPYTSDPIKFSDEYNREAIFPNRFNEYLKVWWNVCLQNPTLAIDSFLKQTSIVWQINEPEGLGQQSTYVTYIHENKYGIERITVSENIRNMMTDYLEVSKTEGIVKMVIWRPALHMFIALFFGYIAYLRFGVKSLLVLLPFMLNIMSIFVAVPAQSYRYLYGTTLVMVIIILYSFLSEKEKCKEC
ncbi:DUF6020 family protein [Mesobacillus jeotgali]|uniref:DUF6020 family protein n=1 Tax=Mesobacillus jeotgali TaxID=129985 RepID=UPI000C84EE67|nr:DUF6020 family protein [Mesobacillus jeotgali]